MGNINSTFNFFNNASSLNNNFITNVERLEIPIPLMQAFQIHFSCQSYDDSLYSTHNIPFPVKLSKASIKRKSEFIAGRVAAKLALEALGIRESLVLYDKNNCPLFPKTVLGSISHSNQIAIAVVGACFLGAGIGVDLEFFLSESSIKAVKNLAFRNLEIQVLLDAGFIERIAATVIFSAKESIFKALFPLTNQYFDFDRVYLMSLNSAECKLTFQLDPKLKFFAGKHLFIEVFYIIMQERVITYTIAK